MQVLKCAACSPPPCSCDILPANPHLGRTVLYASVHDLGSTAPCATVIGACWANTDVAERTATATRAAKHNRFIYRLLLGSRANLMPLVHWHFALKLMICQ